MKNLGFGLCINAGEAIVENQKTRKITFDLKSALIALTQEDIIVGSPIAGRPVADMEKIIGMFVNTLAMRNYPVGTKRFTGFLEEVKQCAIGA